MKLYINKYIWTWRSWVRRKRYEINNYWYV